MLQRDEKVALKAACIQAAAILLAPLSQQQPGIRNAAPAVDTANCARYARDLFGKLTGEKWED